MTTPTIRLRTQDEPLPIDLPPAGQGAVVFTMPPGRYELREHADGTVQLISHGTVVKTGDRASPISNAEVNRRNREFWKTPQCR